jgi:hypothetical protein
MSGTQYNIALAIFFIPYTLAGTLKHGSNRSRFLEADATYRGTQQCDSQSVRSTILVHGCDCHGLGPRDDLPWLCEELPGALWCSCIARIVRVSPCFGMDRRVHADTTGQGGFLPWRYSSHFEVVSPWREPDSDRNLLHCKCDCWCLFWFVGVRNREHGWCRGL